MLSNTAQAAVANTDASQLHEAGSWQERVQQTQVSRLIESSGFGNATSFVMAIIWVILLWQKLPPQVLLVWLGMMSLLFFFRASIHYFGLYKTQKTRIPLEVVRRWYLVAVMVTGAGWGITSVLMFPYNQIEQVVLAFLLVGVSASGIMYSHVVWVYYAYVGFVLLPLMVRLFSIGGEVYYALSAMTGFFLGVMILAVHKMNQSSMAVLELSYKNEGLIDELTRASQDLERLNKSLSNEVEYVKEVETELVEERDRAERMSAAKGQFLANMSHEIRTPMNGVIGTLQLLEASDLTETQREYASTAHKSAEALLSILNDILDLSKIEAGKLSLENITFDLREVISDITALHALSADQKNVNLYSEIDDALPGFVIGDPTRIRQILVNLISNALKFTEKGEVCVRLKLLSHDADNAVVRIEISDTGVGIEKVTLDKLFNAFTQADGSTTRKYGGTGLGLAIVKQLVNLMRGKLGVESEPRKGSTFWFEIPLGVAQSGLKKKPVDEVREKRPMPNARILLAEDNPVNQMVACKMLEKLGLQTVVAANGNLALKQLETEEFDVVLMDCQMPEMDGFAATRILRDYERQMSKPHITVIAMTANVMEGDRERCLDAGMDDYIGKPVKMDELEEILLRWL
jgi:signal transduction histidine kinase/CheY-like chemotaxis protein